MPGILTHSPADILRHLLIELGLGTLPTSNGSWPVSATQLPDTPDSLICCMDTDGVEQGRLMPNGQHQGHQGVQILVRSRIRDTGYTKAKVIANALETVQYAEVAVGAKRYVIDAISRQSDVIPLGTETAQRSGDTAISDRNLFSYNITFPVTQTN